MNRSARANHEPPADPPGVATRRAALSLLLRTLLQRQPFESALGASLASLADARDRAHAHHIALTTLRWLVDLDRLIDSATSKALPADSRARMVLRLALAQALAMETPPHAAVTTALPLVERGPRRLVHAVIGGLLRAGARLPTLPALPEPHAARWALQFGGDQQAALALALKEQPPLDLSLRDTASTEAWCAALGGETLLPGHVRVPAVSAVDQMQGFAEGAWWVQDIAASLPARLLAPAPGTRIADLCAAPGGKTMQLAAMGAAVTAVDSSKSRLARLRQNLARTGLHATLVCADAAGLRADAPFDGVLLDAPCSATGTYRRHPDVLHAGGKAGRPALLARQAALLDHAATLVKPGGRLVYAVCSLDADEGEAQAQAFARRHPAMAMEAVAPGELPGLAAAITPEGWLRTHPGRPDISGGLDGFFVARWRRTPVN